ncbi:Peptidyl-prolyl cis-trans isomerase FKBP19, chloroplastic [Capsicum annuum]|uniref:peptidylprolyl isomerase n=1 Tax=Capsicum annuum TaxID=4072 RepID=A0A1U8FDJ5_CAPAN|nr:peptidyl-prolyl cis-trans isomerase FKBP19, chloroplastic isoform X1 [Capsicum annuum]KAF3661015.1 Peptidyl-prolyl cis-trans isomerase FKBP19, chloroplastic [Capsicum annuum]PHT81067.1 Peptidyl-prolyl cis-trans isomerase FKBP19, chloroplastic [Capsicum annuum]
MATTYFSSLGSFSRLPNSSNFTKTCSPSSPSTLVQRQIVCRDSSIDLSTSSDGIESLDCGVVFDRRQVLLSSVGFLTASISNAGMAAAEFADMPALRGKDYGKTKMKFPDYTETQSGLQYKDLRVGSGPTPKIGETVVVDWDGYTIGYYGRIFEARNKTKGGSFEGDDKDFFKFRVGSQEVIPAFEEAITGMALGGIRRIIVPPELGYPDYDYNKKGPRPTTFSGQRALSFVLRNQGLIDKTLLFDIELLKIIPK